MGPDLMYEMTPSLQIASVQGWFMDSRIALHPRFGAITPQTGIPGRYSVILEGHDDFRPAHEHHGVGLEEDSSTICLLASART